MRLQEYPIRFSIPVQWGDQDSFGHVNNLMYLRWCESARIYYLNDTGIWDLYRTDNIGPILASIHCNFRQPVVFPDQVHTGAKLSRIGNGPPDCDRRFGRGGGRYIDSGALRLQQGGVVPGTGYDSGGDPAD